MFRHFISRGSEPYPVRSSGCRLKTMCLNTGGNSLNSLLLTWAGEHQPIHTASLLQFVQSFIKLVLSQRNVSRLGHILLSFCKNPGNEGSHQPCRHASGY